MSSANDFCWCLIDLFEAQRQNGAATAGWQMTDRKVQLIA